MSLSFPSSEALCEFHAFKFSLVAPACVGIPMVLSGSMGSCAADNASVAMLRRSDSSSTAEEELVALDPLDEQKIARFCFMQYKIPRVPLD
ncbi:hypothetical protein D5086_018249 [Populus alba]|uniref:Uncharacterized protein n=1 Tax=Populus alba TaxID=43335 RepID=A0ACC4BPK0_POPAL